MMSAHYSSVPRRRRPAACLVAMAAAVLATTCDRSGEISTAPSPVKCQVAVATPTESLSAGGGAGTVTVTANPECAWTASAETGWIASLSPASGQGNGDIAFQAAANPLPAQRQGDIVVNGSRARVVQGGAACTFDITPRRERVGDTGARFSVNVTTLTGCTWAAVSNVPWISIASGATGNASGPVTLVVAANGAGDRQGTVAIAGQTFEVTQDAPPPSCPIVLTPAAQSVAAAGGPSAPILVSAPPGCAWAPQADAAWITITSGASGNGNGQVGFSVSANTGAARTGRITIGDAVFTVVQAPAGASACSYRISPSTLGFGAGGGTSAPVTVTTAPACAWTATSDAAWLTIASGANGAGDGAVTVAAAANTGAARTGRITIGDQTLGVTQDAAPSPGQPACTYRIAPTSYASPAEGGSSRIGISAGTGCGWSATSQSSWITITSGGSGSGDGNTSFSVASNSGASRTGVIAIAGEIFTVTQPAAASCSYAVSPTAASFTALGGSATVSVTSTAGCAWVTTNGNSWITVSAGASGTGSGTVEIAAAPNLGPARSGSIVVAGQTVSVLQAAVLPSCDFSIAPTSATSPAAGSTGSVTVTATAGCAWSASSNASWLSITSAASGLGSGSVSFAAAANSGAARSGTLTIAGQTFTVSQAAATQSCTYAIAPASQSFPLLGGSGSVAVTAGAGCSWSASSNAAWITVTSGASGTGNGTVEFAVGLNLLGQRTGTVTIAGQTFTVTQGAILQ